MLSTALAAAPATVERSAKLRSGPGNSYRVLATLPAGAAVEVSGCSGGWCETAAGRRRGYMAQRLLALTGASPATAAAPSAPDEYDSDYPGFDFPGAAYAPAVGVTVTPRWSQRRWARSRYQWRGRNWRPYPVGIAPGVRSPERPSTGRAGSPPAPGSSSGGSIDAPRPTVGIMPDAARSSSVPAAPMASSPAATAAPAGRDGR